MNDKKYDYIGDFISDYVLGSTSPPLKGLMRSIIDRAFEIIPKRLALDYAVHGPTGPYGLIHINVYKLGGPSIDSQRPTCLIYFWWASGKLSIVPEPALVAEQTGRGMKPVIGDFSKLIELTRETEMQFLADYIIARVIAETLRGGGA